MNLPPSSFAGEFRRHALPKLAKICETHALFVALGIETVAKARAEVLAEIWRHDGQYLPEEHFAQLEDWLLDTLMARACVKISEIEARDAAIAHVHTDIERWNDKVLAHFATPEVADA